MDKNNMKRLRRRELLALLLEVSKENDQLREKNRSLEEQLQNKELTIAESGSLAEAIFKLNGVFQAAQDACEQYTYNAHLNCQKMEEDTRERCAQMLKGAQIMKDAGYQEANAENE